jgi:hypothetical protein
MMSALMGKLIYGFFSGLLIGIPAKIAKTNLDVLRGLERGERIDENGDEIPESAVEAEKIRRGRLGWGSAAVAALFLVISVANFPTEGDDPIEIHKQDSL